LLEQNAASTSAVEQQQRTVLTQQQSVQSLTNALNLTPSRRKAIQAAIAVKQAQLAQAQLDADKTVIAAPFDCRIGPVSIEVGQFLAAGQTLFEAHNVDLMEVEAHVAPRDVRNLLQRPDTGKILTLDMETMRNVFKLDAVVRFGQGDMQAQWPARFARVRENLDPETRTLGIVVAIDDPYRRAAPGKQPPPLPGAFCEVELRAQKRIRKVIVPRTAVHDGHVYVVGAGNRLERRHVEVAFAQSDFVAIANGLNAEEIVVVSDPTPAVDGMLIEPVDDEILRQRLVAAATGQGDVR
jgi:RND family efflux transporter MFP subunit